MLWPGLIERILQPLVPSLVFFRLFKVPQVLDCSGFQDLLLLEAGLAIRPVVFWLSICAIRLSIAAILFATCPIAVLIPSASKTVILWLSCAIPVGMARDSTAVSLSLSCVTIWRTCSSVSGSDIAYSAVQLRYHANQLSQPNLIRR